jgi:hypothetical protein
MLDTICIELIDNRLESGCVAYEDHWTLLSIAQSSRQLERPSDGVRAWPSSEGAKHEGVQVQT